MRFSVLEVMGQPDWVWKTVEARNVHHKLLEFSRGGSRHVSAWLLRKENLYKTAGCMRPGFSTNCVFFSQAVFSGNFVCPQNILIQYMTSFSLQTVFQFLATGSPQCHGCNRLKLEPQIWQAMRFIGGEGLARRWLFVAVCFPIPLALNVMKSIRKQQNEGALIMGATSWNPMFYGSFPGLDLWST